MTTRHARAATAAAIGVGLMVAGQSRINAALATRISLGNPTAAGLTAALISFLTGLALLGIALLILPRLRAGMARILAAVRLRSLSPWHLVGGAGGAWLVATQGLTVPTLGVALFIVGVVAGQTAASLGVDAAGLSPSGRLPVTRRRVIAAVLALLAVLVTAAPHVDPATGDDVGLLALLVVTAGAGIAVQQALNGRVAVAAGYPPAAAVVNFIVGTSVLVIVVLLGHLMAAWATGPLPTDLWLYLGGPMGVVFIAAAAWAVTHVGVLRFALASISGQLAGAALVDVLFPQPGVTLGWHLAVGLALTLMAVLVANRR